jgi:phosphate starvation-inducible protein PhoH and related proteins
MPKRKSFVRETRTTRVERNFNPPAPLTPKNLTQRGYIQSIYDYPVVIATGYPGTGKTYIPARMAAQMFNKNAINNIVLSRPSVSTSASIGFFKGTKNEKMLSWLAPVLGALREELSPAQLEYMMKDEVDQMIFCPLETIKGLSWKRSFIIIDEAEDLTLKELRAILTRIGKSSTVVLCGDMDQCDVHNPGLCQLLAILANDPQMQTVVKHIHFDRPDEIVRSPACKEIVLAFERYNLQLKLAA